MINHHYLPTIYQPPTSTTTRQLPIFYFLALVIFLVSCLETVSAQNLPQTPVFMHGNSEDIYPQNYQRHIYKTPHTIEKGADDDKDSTSFHSLYVNSLYGTHQRKLRADAQSVVSDGSTTSRRKPGGIAKHDPIEDLSCYVCSDCYAPTSPLPVKCPSRKVGDQAGTVKKPVGCATVTVSYANGAASIRKRCLEQGEAINCNRTVQHTVTKATIQHECCFTALCNKGVSEFGCHQHHQFLLLSTFVFAVTLFF